MKPPPQRSWPSLILVAVLVFILVVLAALQYRWSGQISQAERDRMQSNLNMSVRQFRNEYNQELQRVCMSFQLDYPEYQAGNREAYARRYENWLQTPANSRLIANIFIWETQSETSRQLLQLNLSTRTFEAVPWPSRMKAVRDEPRFVNPPRVPPGPRPSFWTMIEDLSLLIRPLHGFQGREGPVNEMPQIAGYLLIELSQESLCRELMPELAQRYFGAEQGFIYRIAVISETQPGRIFYQSEPAQSTNWFSSPDARVSLLLDPRDYFARPPEEDPPGGGRSMQGPGPGRQRPARGQPAPFMPRPWRTRNSPMIMPEREGGGWALLAQHHEGTLAEVVASQRRRNLAVGFGILLLLAFSMAMILISARRANRLARLQMEFVAGVSHELRTPLSVICSAGDNLADGIVINSREQVRQYGELVRQEGRRLSAMVEQILQFAATQAGGRKHDLRPEQVDEIVEYALTRLRPMIESAGFTIDKQLDSNLPPAMVDRATLSRCIENLIDNALKYSGKERLISVRAACAAKENGDEIRITVEDHGRGIEPEDLEHIFEPFYRGRAATDTQIHGSGLGLRLAQDGAAAMGGRISVKSKPGVGSAFTIHIPVKPCKRTTSLVQPGTQQQPDQPAPE